MGLIPVRSAESERSPVLDVNEVTRPWLPQCFVACAPCNVALQAVSSPGSWPMESSACGGCNQPELSWRFVLAQGTEVLRTRNTLVGASDRTAVKGESR